MRGDGGAFVRLVIVVMVDVAGLVSNGGAGLIIVLYLFGGAMASWTRLGRYEIDADGKDDVGNGGGGGRGGIGDDYDGNAGGIHHKAPLRWWQGPHVGGRGVRLGHRHYPGGRHWHAEQPVWAVPVSSNGGRRLSAGNCCSPRRGE